MRCCRLGVGHELELCTYHSVSQAIYISQRIVDCVGHEIELSSYASFRRLGVRHETVIYISLRIVGWVSDMKQSYLHTAVYCRLGFGHEIELSTYHSES